MIKFSIIIPHKDIPELLVHCLLTIPVRDDVQVIVVDDNSDPQKVDFKHFPQWGGKNYEYYLTKEGKGAGYARNVGLKYAVGKYLVFADADDWFVPNMWEILSSISKSTIPIHYFKMDSVRVHTGEKSTRHINKNASIDAYLNQQVSCKEAATWHAAVAGQVFLRDFILKNEIAFDEGIVSNDAMFAIKAACLSSKIEFHDDVLYVIGDYGKGLHASKQMNCDRFILMQLTELRIQRYCLLHGIKKRKSCMIKVCLECYHKFGIKGLTASLKMATSEHALFYGLGEYIMRKCKR